MLNTFCSTGLLNSSDNIKVMSLIFTILLTLFSSSLRLSNKLNDRYDIQIIFITNISHYMINTILALITNPVLNAVMTADPTHGKNAKFTELFDWLKPCCEVKCDWL